MENLNDMLHDMRLDDIEKNIDLQFGDLQAGFYDAKMAVMLAMIARQAIGRLNELPAEEFPAQLNEQLEEVRKLYLSKAEALTSHLEENAKIIRAIEKSNADYPDLENDIRSRLAQFDDLIRMKVVARDSSPVSMLGS